MSQVLVDTGACVGAGQCVLVSPEVFDQGEDDGIVILLDAEPDAGTLPTVRLAARLCPAQAIRVLDEA